MPTGEFHFLGFLPEKAGARRTRIEMLAAAGSEAGTLVFYEAPHRILDTLADLEAVFGAELRVVVARELTKVARGVPARHGGGSAAASWAARDRVRGEITLLVQAPGGASSEHSFRFARAGFPNRIAQLQSEAGIDEKEALKRLARELGRSKSDLYRELQRERSRRRT